jgi:hypothetical protein
MAIRVSSSIYRLPVITTFKNPELCVVDRIFRPGDHLEVFCLREVCVEKPTAAGLPKSEPLTIADDIEMP